MQTGFRAPTLTELYRQFSVGAVTTRPNDQLGPERLVGGEAGVNVAPARNVSVRLTWFDNRISNPISNVTLTATLAQKQNLEIPSVFAGILAIMAIGLAFEGLFALVERRTVRRWGMLH